MKTTSQVFKKTEKLELRLAALTREVAGMMQEPASRRDCCGLENAWQKVSHLRQQINAHTRFLKKIKKPVRRNLSKADYRAQLDFYERARGHIMRMRQWKRWTSWCGGISIR